MGSDGASAAARRRRAPPRPRRRSAERAGRGGDDRAVAVRRRSARQRADAAGDRAGDGRRDAVERLAGVGESGHADRPAHGRVRGHRRAGVFTARRPAGPDRRVPPPARSVRLGRRLRGRHRSHPGGTGGRGRRRRSAAGQLRGVLRRRRSRGGTDRRARGCRDQWLQRVRGAHRLRPPARAGNLVALSTARYRGSHHSRGRARRRDVELARAARASRSRRRRSLGAGGARPLGGSDGRLAPAARGARVERSVPGRRGFRRLSALRADPLCADRGASARPGGQRTHHRRPAHRAGDGSCRRRDDPAAARDAAASRARGGADADRFGRGAFRVHGPCGLSSPARSHRLRRRLDGDVHHRGARIRPFAIRRHARQPRRSRT